jgi:hypothetical protein
VKQTYNLSVSLNVFPELLLPEFDTRFWDVGVFAAFMPVPEAAMDENSDSDAR